jgi:thiol-disulfide isomerase/thioredoxin
MRSPRRTVGRRIHRLLVGLGVVFAIWIGCSAAAFARDPDVVLFYREGCHDCEKMDEILIPFQQAYPDLVILRLEETANLDLLWSLSSTYGILPTAFPVIFVGDEAIVGVGRDRELRLRTAVTDCIVGGCPSPLSLLTQPKVPWTLILMVALAVAVFLVVVL